jgi:predicted transcriptional regulator
MEAQKTESEPAGMPTNAEMDILQILWDYGPSTVRFVNDTLNTQRKAVQYTSTLKQMQIMHKNGMLQRDESSMKHIYTAVLEEAVTKGMLSENFVDTHYEGSVSKLLQYFLGRKKTSQSELEAIRHLLNQSEKNNL